MHVEEKIYNEELTHDYVESNDAEYHVDETQKQHYEEETYGDEDFLFLLDGDS